MSLTRLGSANAYDVALTNLGNRQSNLSTLQASLTSGKKINQASDDPTGAAQAERAITRMARITADQRALSAQKNSIAQAESTLGDVTTALQSFRQLVVSAGNAAMTPADRTTVAQQLQALRDQIFAAANSKDSNGMPLFAGLGSTATPFVAPAQAGGAYTFNGQPGQQASSSTQITPTLDGSGAFMSQPARDGSYNVSTSAILPATRTLTTGTVSVTNPTQVTGSSYSITFNTVDATTTPGTTTATYTITDTTQGTSFPPVSVSYPTGSSASITVADSAGPPVVQGMPGLSMTISGTPQAGDTLTVAPQNSLFSTLDAAIAGIGGAANANAANQAVSQALGNLDIGMSKVSAARGQAGALLNLADTINNNQTQNSTQLEATRSSAEDIDMIQAISDFQNQQTGYSAALQSYAQIQKLSLFNYLGN